MTYDRIKFFRRRQFVLGPAHINYEGWTKVPFNHNLFITAHPDLQITFIEKSESKALLLGYFIDPASPELDEKAILQRFVEGPLSLREAATMLGLLTGRFVFILRTEKGIGLFHDACGLRQVNYCQDKNGAIWCASQPEVLAEHLGLELDPDALSFRNMPEFRRTLEDFALIGDRTPYKTVKYLLANHYLDLSQCTAHRFWPTAGCIGSLSVKESIRDYCSILENSIKAAARKFDLKQGISAGCDSRKSLAASKAVKDRITYFTQTPEETHKVDMEIPSRLLPELGLGHYVLKVEQMPEEFQHYYEISATWARERHGHIAYSVLKHFGAEATVLNSNISEYSQVQYWLPKNKTDGRGLAILKGLNHPIAIADFQKWLDDAVPACKESRMNVLVLFQLELRSRWVANTFAECDIAYESFNPYTNRRLYCVELSVNERRRRGRRIDIPIKQIRWMWPEVLIEPINPEKNLIGKTKHFILNSIVHRTITPWISIVEYLKYMKLKAQFNKQSKSNQLAVSNERTTRKEE